MQVGPDDSPLPEYDSAEAGDGEPLLTQADAADEWETEGDWGGIERLLSQLESQSSRAALAGGAPHVLRSTAPPRTSLSSAAAPARCDQQRQRTRRQPRRASWLAWSALSLGLAAFACGAVLIGWSYATARGDLWPLAIPLSLGGQLVLTIGVLLQLEHAGQDTRAALAAVAEIDDRIEELQQATTMIAASHSGPAQSFYAHLAQGAPPDMLLADLKAQLDLITARFAEERRS